MAIMQSHRNSKLWRIVKSTAPAVKITSIQLSLEVAIDYRVTARVGHSGYFHLLQIHFKSYKMEHEELKPPIQREYPEETYQYILFDNKLQIPIIDMIQANGLVNASIAVEHKSTLDQHLVSISLMPKIEQK